VKIKVGCDMSQHRRPQRAYGLFVKAHAPKPPDFGAMAQRNTEQEQIINNKFPY